MPLSSSISTRLRHQHESLPEIIDDLSEEELRRRPNPEKWSPYEQIAHLAAYQPVFLSRLELMTTQTGPSFDRYVADNDPQFHACVAAPLQQLLTSMSLNGARIAERISRLTDADLLRTGRHMKYGELSIPQWSEFYLLHEAHHLFTIFMLSQALRAERS